MAILEGAPTVSKEGNDDFNFYSYNKEGNLQGISLSSYFQFAGTGKNIGFTNATIGKSVPNFNVGMKLGKFEDAMSKAAKSTWSVSKDGKVKSLMHNGITYISRSFSKSAGSTVEIWKDGKLVLKYRLLD